MTSLRNNSSLLRAIQLTARSTSQQPHLFSQPKIALWHAGNADIMSHLFNKTTCGLDVDRAVKEGGWSSTLERDQALPLTIVSEPNKSPLKKLQDDWLEAKSL